MTARTVIYTRSNPRTSAETSEMQEGACRRLAEERGWEVVGVYADRTSASAFSRPALDRAMNHIRSGGCDALAACESERAARIAEETVGDASAE